MVNTRDGEVMSQSQDGVKIVKSKKFLAQGGDALVPCKVCKKELATKGIQCDRCCSWLHLDCSGIKAAHFKFLDESQVPGLRWHCPGCVVDLETDPDEPNGRLAQQDTKIDNLGLLVQAVQSQQAGMMQLQASMQQQNQAILEILKDKNRDCGLEKAIKVQVSELIENQSEKEEKKNNLIIRNVPEVHDEEDNVNKTSDQEAVNNILRHVHPSVGDQVKVIRLGKPRSKDSKPRPIKITLSDDDRSFVLNNEKKLKTYNIKNIRIFRDKTKKEQDEDRQKYAECQKKREDTGEDYIIFRGDIVLRGDIPDIIKTQKSIRDGQPLTNSGNGEGDDE